MGNADEVDKYPWYTTNTLMAGFGDELRRRSLIWAAKDHECPKCKAPAYTPCKNLTGIKTLGFEAARENKQPHTERIDYKRLELELRQRGYGADPA